MIDSTGQNVYYRLSGGINWAANSPGTNNHLTIVSSKQREYLFFRSNALITNDVATKFKLNYNINKYHFANNDASPNDYYIWWGKCIKDMPAKRTILGVDTTYTTFTDYIQAACIQHLQETQTSSTPAMMLNQYDFSPKDIWNMNSFIKWGKPKFKRLDVGQRMTIKISDGSFTGPWNKFDIDTGEAGALPAYTGTLTDQAATPDMICYKGNWIVWIMSRGSIGNTSLAGTGASGLTRSKTDIIYTNRSKYTVFATKNVNYQNYQDNITGSTVYVTNDSLAQYTT